MRTVGGSNGASGRGIMDRRQRQPGPRTEILRLLCTAPRTSRALAAELGISSNAVRKTLARLATDGLVRYERVARGVGKPSHEYHLTTEGEALVSRAYLPLLDELLWVLEARLPQRTLEALLRETGARLAAGRSKQSDSLRVRMAAAAALLNDFGATATVRRSGNSHAIECSCCAVGVMVVKHALVCKSMETLLTGVVGVSLTERCERAGRPRCRFELAVNSRMNQR